MNTVSKGAGGITYEVVGDIVRFPLWWYTAGMMYVIGGALSSWQNYGRNLGIFVWIKNIFVPMFGQYDWQGRIISVFMRSAQIFFRSIALFVYGMLMSVVVMTYIALPLVAFAFLLFHVTGGLFGLYE